MTTKFEARNDKLRAAHDKLQDAVAEIVSGDEWKRMLKVASKFHRYSFNNHQMIFLQRPDATVVAGFNRWKSLGRSVKKGEKGIGIFAPCRYKVDPSLDGPAAASSAGKNKTDPASAPAVKVAASEGRPTADGFSIRGFRVVHVFDISQTEGEDLPDLDAVRPKLLDADAPKGSGTRSPVTRRRSDTRSSAISGEARTATATSSTNRSQYGLTSRRPRRSRR
jgi:hypothetical protein